MNVINTGWKKVNEVFYDSMVLSFITYLDIGSWKLIMTKYAGDDRIMVNKERGRRDLPYFSVEG